MTESSRQIEQNTTEGTRPPVKWLIATVKESDTTVTIQFPTSLAPNTGQPEQPEPAAT